MTGLRVEDLDFPLPETAEGRLTHACFSDFPALLRALRVLEPHLAWLPLGAQYYVCAAK